MKTKVNLRKIAKLNDEPRYVNYLPFSEIGLVYKQPARKDKRFKLDIHKWGPKWMHFDWREVKSGYKDNVSRMFGNALNFYTTKIWWVATLEFLAFAFSMFDNYSDINYIANTEFNQKWMYYTSVFLVFFPYAAFLVMSLKIIESESLRVATYLANVTKIPNALNPKHEYLLRTLNRDLIAALFENIPQVML